MSSLVEHTVLTPLKNPAGGFSPDWYYAGQVDRLEGGTLIDWKSCGDPSRFLDSKVVGYQPECYTLAMRQLGYPVEEFVYRVIQTPSIKYSKKDDSLQAYEDRCLDWLREKSGRCTEYHHHIAEAALRNAEHWLWNTHERIELNREKQYALTNESACHAFNVRCPYVPLCRTAKIGDDVQGIIEEFYEERRLHQELELPEGARLENVLTYSRASRFSLCEMREYWENAAALKKKGDEDSNSLYIGSAMHKGLEEIDNGVEAALQVVDKWAKAQLVVGPYGKHKRDQELAKAKAMIRRAAEVWELG